MEFKDTVTKYFADHDINVLRVEQEGDVRSIVCHVPASDNNKVSAIASQMEADLDVVVQPSNMFGMNVVIVEANDLEDED